MEKIYARILSKLVNLSIADFQSSRDPDNNSVMVEYSKIYIRGCTLIRVRVKYSWLGVGKL